MSSATVQIRGAEMGITQLGEAGENARHLVWAHGWGQSGAVFLDLARSFERAHPSILIDFPGFGRSLPPPAPWGTAEYADAVAEWLHTIRARSRIWIGHSFGCRVGLQIAARHPGLLDAMVLIAAAGLPRRRTLWETARLKARIYAFKLAKLLTPEGPARDRLRARFGSADYRSAGPMRPIFLKVIAEDLTDVARTISCPTLLLYGQQDRETPPEMGERLKTLITGAHLVLLDGYDHYSILARGQHQVANEIRKFIGRLP